MFKDENNTALFTILIVVSGLFITALLINLTNSIPEEAKGMQMIVIAGFLSLRIIYGVRKLDSLGVPLTNFNHPEVEKLRWPAGALCMCLAIMMMDQGFGVLLKAGMALAIGILSLRIAFNFKKLVSSNKLEQTGAICKTLIALIGIGLVAMFFFQIP